MSSPVALAVAAALTVVLGHNVALAQAGMQSAGKTDPALTKLAKELEAAFNMKDASKVAAFYTEDAALNPPNEPAIRGRANIEAWFKKGFDTVSGITLTPCESAKSGAVGYEAGTYSITVAPTGGTKMTDTGKYVEVFKQVGGKCLIALDIFNSDLPPPKQGS
jgi:ketosteroid isomerase-like protein